MPGNKWSDDYYVRVYRLRRDGMGAKANVALALGVDAKTLQRWFDERPALRAAWDLAAEEVGAAPAERFREYIYQKLPPKLQGVWDELTAIENDPCAVRRIEEIFATGGRRMRQHIFVHALCVGNFNPSIACRFVGISKATLDGWTRSDPDFAELIREVVWHRKNFYEGALNELVMRGEPAAVIFANRTQNVDRGYGKTAEVNINHSGTVGHNHTMVDFERLDLPLEVKVQVLAAIRRQAAAAGMPALPGTVVPATPNITNIREDTDEQEAA